MSALVNNTPQLPNPPKSARVEDVFQSIKDIVQALYLEFTAHAQRLNIAVVKNGSEGFTGYTVATLPSATATGVLGAMIFVSNETGGATMAFSDGTNWRRVQDRAIVS